MLEQCRSAEARLHAIPAACAARRAGGGGAAAKAALLVASIAPLIRLRSCFPSLSALQRPCNERLGRSSFRKWQAKGRQPCCCWHAAAWVHRCDEQGDTERAAARGCSTPPRALGLSPGLPGCSGAVGRTQQGPGRSGQPPWEPLEALEAVDGCRTATTAACPARCCCACPSSSRPVASRPAAATRKSQLALPHMHACRPLTPPCGPATSRR